MKVNIPQQTYLYLTLIIVGASAFFFSLLISAPRGFYSFIVVAAVAGFGVALNIYDTKHRGEHLVCPTGSNCDVVVTSRYSRFFGISLEYWGMAYFAVIALSYLLLIFAPGLFSSTSVLIVMFLSLAAGLFSLYLLFVQAFLLRQWCIWCLLTAFLSLSIAVVSLVSADAVTVFLAEWLGALEVIHSLGFTFGVGGVATMAFLFFHFLRDASIDDKELDAIKSVSEIVWLGLGLVLVSSFARYIAQPELLSQSGPFIAEMSALLVSALAGAVLMVIYAPFLIYVPFESVKKGDNKEAFVNVRYPAMIAGSILVVSWFYAFAMIHVAEASSSLLVGIYVFVLIGVLLAVNWWHESMHVGKEETSKAKKSKAKKS